MAGLSSYAQSLFLRWLAQGVAAPTAPNPVFISLHTSDPAQTGASEVSGGSYARVSVSTTTASAIFGGGNVAAAVPAANGTQRQVGNSATITFAAPTGAWGTVGYFGVWDAATTGNFLIGGALTSSIAPLNGNAAPSFAVGACLLDMQ